MTDPNYAPAWVVDSQSQRTKATPSGSIEEGYDVNYHTSSGHYGTVFVPNARYTPANVAAAIAADAARLDAVGALTADSEV